MPRTPAPSLRWSAAVFPSTDPTDLRVITGHALMAERGRADALSALSALLSRPFHPGDLTVYCSVTVGFDNAFVALHGAPDLPTVLRRVADAGGLGA